MPGPRNNLKTHYEKPNTGTRVEAMMRERNLVLSESQSHSKHSAPATAPLQDLTKEDALNPSFVATVLRSLLAVDLWASKQLGVYAREDSAWASARLLMKAIEILGDGYPWLAGTLCGLYITDSPTGREVLINLLFALVLDLILVGVLKGLVKRRRPTYNETDMFITISVDKYSFPSGHSTRAAMVSRFVLENLTLAVPLQVLVVLWALVVGISRVMLGRHNVTDVLFGLVMGYMQYSVVEYFWLSPATVPALFTARSESKCLAHNL
ncbi:polyisoprenoid diphosphate/phosphate phosphohydrolase PLPP6-like [Eublepharis macularius]|uniref:Polyisoprenoid diphosphate/phosphate phosphohydrolase PLPP6 n=1 Tax=Eublepharis macularius TaxID=481883 RepID=A0AA97L803_EUBMA|nr:polyisoprenoid diphosphate/phosphate phosphohydrolase PLPP6-like [Eublepharis macularius]